ncbi:MAG: YihY family inner membrane protein [Alphaproteobacteria bacterium]|nr:YihY family inner membrane protein [Alphaproteobacteria bacterium]
MTRAPETNARRRDLVTAEFGFARAALARFREERGLVIAASLSYTSLLALVPLVAISLSILSAFPAFEDVQGRLLQQALGYVAPHAGAEVQTYLDQFVSNTSNLTALGIVWLAVTAIMLLSTIESGFNAIWRVDSPRPLMMRLVAYWTTLTLGPLLLGAGLSLSTVIFASENLSALGIESGMSLNGAVRVIPLIFAAVGLTILYLALPHRRIEWRHALLGGLIAAILFEGLKALFGIYLSRVGTFQSVYGSLSALPVFLIWMYLGWAVVLFGAAIAAARPEWLAARASEEHGGPLTPARCLLRALQVIDVLHTSGQAGDTANNDMLLAAASGDGDALAMVMMRLHNAGYIARTDADTAVLIRDLDDFSLHDLYQALGFAIDTFDPASASETPWASDLAALLAEADDAGRNVLAQSIRELLSKTGPRLVVEIPTETSAS